MNTNESYFKNCLVDVRNANDIKELQVKEDVAIALHRKFGFGRQRLLELWEEVQNVQQEFSKVVIDDSKDDKNIIYSKEKRDEALRECYGKDFPDHDTRYCYDRSNFVHVHAKKHHGRKKKK